MKTAFGHLCSSLFWSRGGRFRGSRPHFWGPDILLSLLGDLKGCRFLCSCRGIRFPGLSCPENWSPHWAVPGRESFLLVADNTHE